VEERALFLTLDLLDPRKVRGRLRMLRNLLLLGLIVWVRAVLVAPRAKERRAVSRARHEAEAARRIAAHEATWADTLDARLDVVAARHAEHAHDGDGTWHDVGEYDYGRA
jgi:hypothetical protein